MIKHKVKYRVVGADRSKRKYSINLDEGTPFQLTRELLQGTPAQEGSKPVCSYMVQNGALWIRVPADQGEIVLNGKPIRECEVRPGDLAQIGEFSIEILECPHAARSENNATQFLDVSEMFGTAAKATNPTIASEPAPVREPASTIAASEPAKTEAPIHTAAASEIREEFPPLAQSFSQDAKSEQTRVVEQQTRVTSSTAARTRATHEESRSRDEAPRSSAASPRPRTNSHRDSERYSQSQSHSHSTSHAATMNRHPKRTDENQKRRQPETATAAFTDSDFSHLAMSAGMAALGVAATTRVLVSGSATPQGMVVACAALSSVPVVIGLSLGLVKLNEYLNSEAHLRDYARFLGWALICSVPWAYTQGASFPIAIFTTLLTTVLISVAFVARFRPNMARFSGVGAGLSAAALAALITQHHYSVGKSPAGDSLSADNTSLADASTTNATASATNPQAALNTGAAPIAQAGGQMPPAASPNSLQPGNQPQGQLQGGALAQQGVPAIPSAVNDTIPPIPNHADTTANALGRTPANMDSSSKGIIDPLAHEEFFSAIKMGNLEVVKSLIDRKQVDPDFTLDKGSTPLIVAAASGRLKVAEYLLRRRVNINAQDPHGTTALMWAVFKGHRDVAKFLISKGADTKVIRDDGDTAMDIARKWRQTEIVALLKEASQDENGSGSRSRSPASRKRRHR